MADGIVFTDCAIWYDGEDLTTQSNEVSASFTRDALDRSAFGSSWKARKAGAASGQASAKCFWIADPVDNQQWPEVGGAGVLTLAEADTAGEDAWMMQTAGLEYGQGGRFGELMMASPRWGVDGLAARGVVMQPKIQQSASNNSITSGAGAIQLGSVTSGKALMVVVHVLAHSGAGTVDYIIQNSATSGGTYADNRTIASSVSATGANVLVSEATTANTWWRITWVLTGTATFQFAVSAGITALP